MKRTTILDALQVAAAILITSGMVAYAAPVIQPVTPPTKPVAVVKKTPAPVVAPVVAVPEPAPVVVPTPVPEPVVAAPVIAPAADCGDPHAIVAAAGQSESDFGAIDYIIGHEGGWCGATRWNTAGSGAYGICQSLPASKMASAGDDWATNPVTQLKWCAEHAAGMGGWWPAKAYWQSHGNW